MEWQLLPIPVALMRVMKVVVIFRGFQNRVKRHVVCVVQKVSNMENPGQTHNIDLIFVILLVKKSSGCKYD